MTALTPNFSLPYPDALDEPCDFAEDWCMFTEAINAVATRYETTVNRTVPVIPMARMTLTAPVTILNGANIPFDSVNVNTAGWIDFDASSTDITPDRAGYFVVVANALIATSGILGTIFTLQLGTGSNFQDNQIDRATASVGNTISQVRRLTGPTALNVRVAHSNAVDITIGEASFSVWWHADTATP